MFEKNIKKMEKSKICVIEVKKLLDDTKESLIERKAKHFIGIQTKIEITKLKETSSEEAMSLVQKFETEISEFFEGAIGYLEKWSRSFVKFSVFDWMQLSPIPEWENIEQMIVYLISINVHISGESCFDQFIYLKTFLTTNINLLSEEWKCKSVEERWLYFLKNTDHLDKKSEFIKMCEYLFSIPAHNANSERIFSLMASQWTDERNRLLAESVEAILQCQYNFKMTCSEFYKYIKTQKDILKKVKSSEKYLLSSN